VERSIAALVEAKARLDATLEENLKPGKRPSKPSTPKTPKMGMPSPSSHPEGSPQGDMHLDPTLQLAIEMAASPSTRLPERLASRTFSEDPKPAFELPDSRLLPQRDEEPSEEQAYNTNLNATIKLKAQKAVTRRRATKPVEEASTLPTGGRSRQ